MSSALAAPNLDRLAESITELSAQIYAATARLHTMIGEFDRRGGWAGAGIPTCAHWLELQCGLTPSAARETVRVARALEALPATAVSFGRGEISESAVRTITRGATVETEDVFIQFARYGTGGHLEKLARWHRRLLATCTPDQQQRVVDRYLRFRYDDDGSLRINGRFPPDEGELIRRTLEAVADELREKRGPAPAQASSDAQPPDVAVPAPEPYRADPILEALIAIDEEPDPDSDLDDPVVSVPAQLHPFETAAYEQRNADALRHLAETYVSGEDAVRTNADRYTVIVHVDEATLRGAPADAPRSELARGIPIPADVARTLACDASLVTIIDDAAGNPLDVGRKTRTIPTRLRRALESRDGGCRYPGCTARRYTHAHHVRERQHGGETSLANLVTLCGEHHRRHHRGEFLIESPSPGKFIFRHPAGWVIGRADLYADGTDVTERPSSIDSMTCRSQWRGEHPDYGVALNHLMAHSGPAPPDG